MQTTTYTRPAEPKTQNREAWLTAAADQLWGRVLAAGGERPKACRVSCGWPSKSALRTASSRSRRIGEAWHSDASEDGSREVFISPALADEVEVMDVLLHELIHAALPADAGHGPAFQAIMRAVGLEGKPTATVAGEELVAELRVIAHELGRYPHAKLDSTPRSKKPGRMVKGYCPDCGNIFYGSRTAWEVVPECGVCHTTYVVDPSPEQAAHWGIAPAEDVEPLDNVATTVELKTRDGRFDLRTTKTNGREGSWTVTDHEAVEVRVREVGGLDLTEHEPRWTYRRNRADALAFIAAIRSGELTWDVVEVEEAELEEVDEDDLGEVGDWSAEDGDHFLDEDEEEDPDYPEDQPLDDAEVDESLSGVERAKLFTTRPATESEYARMEELRNLSGTRKSESIASGDEGAMD